MKLKFVENTDTCKLLLSSDAQKAGTRVDSREEGGIEKITFFVFMFNLVSYINNNVSTCFQAKNMTNDDFIIIF